MKLSFLLLKYMTYGDWDKVLWSHCSCGFKVLSFKVEGLWFNPLAWSWRLYPRTRSFTHVCPSNHPGVQMGSDIGWGCKPVTDWHRV